MLFQIFATTFPHEDIGYSLFLNIRVPNVLQMCYAGKKRGKVEVREYTKSGNIVVAILKDQL